MRLRRYFRRRSRNRRTVVMERRQWFLGTMATLAVAFIWWGGGLYFLELITQDWRQFLFYSRTKDPSPLVALVAIDDQSLDTVGRWPWDREKMAQIVGELQRAQTNTVALDILFNEPQNIRYIRQPNPLEWEYRDDEQLTPEQLRPVFVEIADDLLLDEAIYAHGRVVLAAKFPFLGGTTANAPPPKPAATPKPTTEPATESIAPPANTSLSISVVFDAIEHDPAVRKALERLEALPGSAELSLDRTEREQYAKAQAEVVAALQARIYPNTKGITLGQEVDKLRRGLDRVRSINAASAGSSIPLPTEELDWPRSVDVNPPIRRLSAVAAKIANVSFDSSDPGGVTRRVPLWVTHGQRLWPTLGLAAVMEFLGISTDQVRIEDHQTVLQTGEQSATRFDMMRSRLERGNEIDGLTYVTWPRGGYRQEEQVRRSIERAREVFIRNPEKFQLIFARPPEDMRGWEWQLFDQVNASTNVISAGRLYEPILQLDRIRTNIIELSRLVEWSFTRTKMQMVLPEQRDRFRLALRRILRLLPLESGEFVNFDPDDRQWLALLDDLKSVANAGVASSRETFEFSDIDPSRIADNPNMNPEDKNRFDTIASGYFGVPLLLSQIDAAILNITMVRRDLTNLLGGKIVVVGFTATGTDADVVITPAASKTPGPMVHVAVINSIFQRLHRVPWPWWADFTVITLMGLSGTWLGVRFNVVTGPLALIALILGWFAVAGAILWDNSLTIAAVAAPSVAATAGWVTVLLHRLLVEQRGRKVTEERFKSYVSPAVVDILVNNPELGTMKPSMREMTVMFTDVADFTTTSERLGPELLAKCLSKYLKEMTEILQKNRGTLDKYLGDGIMCFWNAPIDDPDHSRNACMTAVQMMKRLEELNDSGAFEEAGRLKVRVGVCTGPCMVGDFGNPPRNSNYTLLGDTANFAARLEGANKFFGTRILGTQRVRDQSGPDVRWRTIGKVFVKGKQEADTLYELIGTLEPHGPATEDWIELSNSAVADFAERDFDMCLKKFDVLARRFGDVQLAALYTETIQAWRTRPDYPAAFDGAIVLTEK